MKSEPTRQIHLDFHTSEHLPGIGSEFSKPQFQSALQTGHVDLINVFAKCHHSWSYYPTKIGKPHPNLQGDLLGGQIEACHEIGVAAPIYFTVGWSAYDAETHPDWCVRTKDGNFAAPNWPADAKSDDPKPTFQWKELCVTGEYHDLVKAQTAELCDLYDVDGLWYDIYHPQILCYCERCRAGMAAEGVDIDDTVAVEAYRARTILKHAEDLTSVITAKHPDASIYFNGLTAIERSQNFRYRMFQFNTKNDLEDLPTTWGGYDKFPLRAKIFHREEKPVVAMSGKFHTAWGEFGGFKDPEALRFEAASMIAYGAACNFGDHLHPLGSMDMTTYQRVGHAFGYVKQIEEYGIGGKPAASLGFWASYELQADEGLARILLEEHLDFDVVASGDDLSRFETIIVPSQKGVLDGAVDELTRYLGAGGKLVVIGEGALDSNGAVLAFSAGADLLGAKYLGVGEFDVDYTLLGETLLAAGGEAPAGVSKLPQTPFLNYTSGLRFELDADAESLATIEEPYFSRTYGHYCGHQNTPNRPGARYPAAWKKGNVVVVAHALDRLYYQHGAKVHRDYLSTALRLVHSKPMVEADLPSAARVSLLHQPSENRYVAHLLYGPPIERGRCVVIEDLPELRDVQVRLRVPEAVKALRLVPGGEELQFRKIEAAGTTGGADIETTVPRFRCHAAVVVEY